MHYLRTFGALIVEQVEEATVARSLPRGRLAILAVLAAAGDLGVSRDRLQGMFWPESDTQRARNALNQALHSLRRGFGADELVLGTSELRLNPLVMRSDVGDFQQQLAAGNRAEAVARYSGPFLDGIHIKEASGFERWADEERSRLANTYHEAVEALAAESSAAGDVTGAVKWWRTRANAEPTSARVALCYMRALTDAGDREAAIRHASTFSAILQDELGVAAPDVDAYAESLRTSGPRERVKDVRRLPTTRPLDDTATTQGPIVRHGVWRRQGMVAAGIVGLVVIVALLALPFARGTGAPSNAPDAGAAVRLAILPFRVETPDSLLGFLSQGTADLLATKLDFARIVLVAPKPAAGERAAGSADDEGARVAECAKMSAKYCVTGSIVGDRQRMVIAARLTTVNGGSRSSFEVSGPIDSLGSLVDRLATRLIAGVASSNVVEELELATHPFAALRSYLRGQNALRAGQMDSSASFFREALALDSTFAFAALGLAETGAFAEGAPHGQRAGEFEMARRLSARLTPQLRAVFDASVVDHATESATLALTLARWTQAFEEAPSYPDVAYEYGDRLFHSGQYLGIANEKERAEQAFSFALSNDSSLVIPMEHLIELAIDRGDSARVYRLFRSYPAKSADASDYVRWRVVSRFGSPAQRTALSAELPHMSRPSIRRVMSFAQLRGEHLDDAAVAATAMAAAPGSHVERSYALVRLHAYFLNRGDTARAANALRELDALDMGNPQWSRWMGDAQQVMVLDALVSLGDSLTAKRVVARFPRVSAERGSEGRAFRTVADRCVRALWQLGHGDVASARDDEAFLATRNPASIQAERGGWNSAFCAIAARSLRSHMIGDASADVLLDSLTAFVTAGPRALGVNFGNVLAARLLLERGRPADAMRLAQRWQFDIDGGPPYLAELLQIEWAAARRLGNAEVERVARAHYVALRGAPPREVTAFKAKITK